MAECLTLGKLFIIICSLLSKRIKRFRASDTPSQYVFLVLFTPQSDVIPVFTAPVRKVHSLNTSFTHHSSPTTQNNNLDYDHQTMYHVLILVQHQPQTSAPQPTHGSPAPQHCYQKSQVRGSVIGRLRCVCGYVLVAKTRKRGIDSKGLQLMG